MKYISGTKDFKLNHTALALGKFDGLHRGHQVLFDQIRRCKAQGLTSVMFTFDFHPNNLFGVREQQLINTAAERRYLAEKMGFDVLVEYPFTMETANMPPEQFVKEILAEKTGAGCIAVGEDYHFGCHRSGDIHTLEALSSIYNYDLIVCPKVCDIIPEGFDGNAQEENREISATLIRRAIEKGNIELANRFLGYPLTIRGEVVHGRQIGRTIGMPTANIIEPSEKLLPPNGVYYSKTRIDDDCYISVTNIGYNPTVAQNGSKRIETFIFDFNGDLYGRMIDVELYYFGRPERKFVSLDELKAQMHRDGENSREYFKML